MKFWRIYRLPGSRSVWHIDTGPNTAIINVRAFSLDGTCAASVDMGTGFPRAWIEIPYGSTELYIIQDVAIWRAISMSATIPICEVDKKTHFGPCCFYKNSEALCR